EGPVLDVVVVPLDPVRERGLAAKPVHLRPARDPRLHAVAVLVAADTALPELHEFSDLGAGADDAHLAAQHVEELRQLVDGVAAHEAADAGAPVLALDSADAGVAGGELDRPGVFADAHAPELGEVERAATAPDAALAVE